MKTISAVVFLYLTSFLQASAKAQWTFEPSMPTARWTHAVVAGLDGTIYAIGGFDYTVALSAMEAYDPLSQTWTRLTPMPTPRANPAAAVADDGRIFVFGGHDGSRSLGIVEAYELPTGRYNLAAAVAIDGRIYAMGGFDEFYGYAHAVEVYDPSNDRWTAAPSMPTGREGLGGVRGGDDRIYAIGGLTFKPNGLVVLTSVEAYTP